ncbi:MAG TPA: response regulator [Acidimicrobiales bacterium]|nr:response regulator [Acidimicrobiales bacterium]
MAERHPVRTVVVDDSDEIRTMLRLVLGRDPRFEVVGEASDGRQAIEVVGRCRPELVILDLAMPVMGGLEALPHIRRQAPGAQVIVYTSGAQPAVRDEAVSQGAVGVLDKAGLILDLPEEVVRLVLDSQRRSEGSIEVRVGPVDSSAARVWVRNTRRILDAVEARPEVLGDPVPAEAVATFRSFLDSWEAMADSTEQFMWRGRARAVEVEVLAAEWARIDAMSDEQLARLGCRWSPPEGAPFFEALSSGVLDALRHSEETRSLADKLAAQFDV